MNFKEMIGKVYGDMRVIRRATQEETPWKSHETPLWVKCIKCGHEWSARKGDIEKKKQCPFCNKIGGRGHYDKEMIGRRFGYLTVIDYDQEATLSHGNANGRKSYWVCRCDCGNVVSVRRSHLEGEDGKHPTISCGCATRSSGEINTENTLLGLGVKIKREVVVPECHKWSPFDLGVYYPNSDKLMCFFECDGEQHFKFTPRFHDDEEDFIHQQETDNIKTNWCAKNNVPLFRIPYTDYTKINAEYLFSRFPEFKKLLDTEESR